MPTLDDLIGYDPPADLKGVDSDAYAKVYLPSSTAQWTTLLSGSGLNVPSSFWKASDASGTSLADRGTGGRTVTLVNSPTLGAAAPGFAATGIKCTDNSNQYAWASIPNVVTTSAMMLQIYAVGSNPAADRSLGKIGSGGYESAQITTGTSGPKLQARSGANISTGNVNYSSILVVVTRLDRTSGSFGVYSRGEQIKPTYSVPAASTDLYILGDVAAASDATLVYAAFWSGADAEISEANIQKLIDFVYGDSTTLSKMQSGSMSGLLVAAIEGCEHLLCESQPAAALRAWAGSDYTTALAGLHVELKNSQTLTPWEPFTSGGSCTLRIVPDAADTFGVLVNKRSAGAETELVTTIDRNDATIAVASTQDFASSGTVYIGTEGIGYTGKTATTFTGCTRGKYSPFGCAISGSGGTRFSGHHRVGGDAYHVQMKPLVTQQPRVWLGKRVGVWFHTYDAANGTMNSRDEAQLVFAGRIAGIADDGNSFETVIDIEPIHEEIRNGVIGKDMWAGEIAKGLEIKEGRRFKFTDYKDAGVGVRNANDLVVVASGAAGTNQMDAGIYSNSLLCEKLSAWLAAETAAARLWGSYTWYSPVTSNVGLRTKCYASIAHASDVECYFSFFMPGETAAFLGMTDTEPSNSGATEWITHRFMTNGSSIKQGKSVPFVSLVFKPTGPGRLAQEFSEIVEYSILNERGVFIDQYNYLPASIKSVLPSGYECGLFLLNEQVLIVAVHNTGTLSKIWIAPFKIAGDNSTDSVGYYGTRADEPESGAVTVRQVLWLEAPFARLLAEFMYGTGTSGYNHSDYDTLGPGLGLGIPGEMLGGSFERSLNMLPGASAPTLIIIDEPTKLTELVSADLVVRRSFLRWKDESWELAQWKTPSIHDAVADLTESNKASPAGYQENHRSAALESREHARPIVKLDYSRDLAASRDGQYLKSVQIEDQTAVDDAGGSVQLKTLKLRNCYSDMQQAGAAVEALIPDFIAMMPVLGRPFRALSRSIDLRFFEGYGVGDVFTVTDSFARDPLTGKRGITQRAAFVSRISYDLGGHSADGSTRPMGGEVELQFLDAHRGELYSAAGQVDDTAATGGYVAGTKTLTLYTHAYSHSLTVSANWGRLSRLFHIEEAADASNFPAGSKVNVIEMDSTTPLSWSDTVATQSGNTLVLTTGLAGWDATKRYRVVPQTYSACTIIQQDSSFQADRADGLVENDAPFYHHSTWNPEGGYVPNTGNERAELIPTNAWGDGRPYDVGYDRSLVTNVNQYIDRKSAHQCPLLWHYEDTSGSASSYLTLWTGLVYLGMDHTSSTVERYASLAPMLYTGGGPASTAWLRITLSDSPPIQATHSGGGALLNFARFAGRFASQEWSTTSLTYETGASKAFNLSAKNLELGYVWVTVEGKDNVFTRGIGKFIEGVRTVV